MQCLLLYYHVNDSGTLYHVLISVAASRRHLRSTASTVLYEHAQKSPSDHIIWSLGLLGLDYGHCSYGMKLYRAMYMHLPTVEPRLHHLGM